MYKWHVHSAIGRGRPAANDFLRVADGIAASLRQFSISASRYAEDDGNRGTQLPPAIQLHAKSSKDVLRITRSRPASDALREVSNLAPTPSRGIDARSFAAKPPQSFTIRRVQADEDFRPKRNIDSSYVSRNQRDGADGNGFRGGPRMASRGGPRGGARGGLRGRGGARGGRGRGRGKGLKKREPRKKEEDDMEIQPYTKEELEYVDNAAGGFIAPYTPITSAQDLSRWGPPVASTPRGIVESLAYKMAVATDNVNPEFKSAQTHLRGIKEGSGALFENAEERAQTQTQRRREIQSLSKADQEDMMNQWVGGQYASPKTVEPNDVLGQIAAYARRNETYLPADARKFEDKLRSLLPATMSTPKPKHRVVQKPL